LKSVPPDRITEARRHLTDVVLFGLAYYVCAWLTHLLYLENYGVSVPFWLPLGFYVGVLLRTEQRRWPDLAIGAYAADFLFVLIHGRPLGPSLLIAVADGLEALVCSGLMWQLIRRRPTFTSLRELAALAASATASCALGGVAGALAEWWLRGDEIFWRRWVEWCTGDVVSILLLAPLVLSAPSVRQRATGRLGGLAERVCYVLALIACVFFTFFHDRFTLFSGNSLLVLLALWSGLRFGVRFTAAAVLGVSTMAVFRGATVFGSATALSSEFSSVSAVQGFLISLALGGLVPAVILEESREAEESLRQRTLDLRNAHRIAGLGGWVIRDLKSGSVDWSEEICHMEGWGEAGRPKTLGDLTYYTPDSLERLRNAVETTERYGTGFALELEGNLPTGERIWRAVRGEVENGSGNVKRLRGTFQDITERVRTEQTMRSLAAAIQFAGEQVLITDRHGNIQYCNPAFERATGYSREEASARNSEVLSRHQHRDARSDLGATIRAGKAWTGQINTRRKDGSTFVEDATLSPIPDAAQGISGFVILKHDVTERISLENQLRQSQKLDSVGRLAGGVAHDFNNLLTVIMGYSRKMLSRAGPESPSQAPLTQVLVAAERAAALTRQLLSFSRRNGGVPETVSLAGLVEGIEPMLRRLIEEHIEISLRFDSEESFIFADPNLVEQIVVNLAVNSRDAMPDGGTLLIETKRVAALDDFSAQCLRVPVGVYVSLTVTDSGAGMTPEAQSRLFEPFYTTKEPGKGTGLGLSTVYGIVKQSGGSINVHSTPGIGTSVKVLFPSVSGYVPAAKPESVERHERGAETVLLVEDQDGVRAYIRDLLSEYGYTVLSAASGPEAIGIAERFKGAIHVLLTDVVLPGMNGVEVIRRFLAIRPDTPVIRMSGYPERFGAPLNGDIPYLQKPFTPEELLGKIRNIFDGAPDAAVH
jgi:PAS domain S-box-containing protein